MDERQAAALFACAAKARDAAYSPYSNYQVGAALVTEDDRVFFGCNVENASYGLSLCAERAAISAAVANGAGRIKALVVVTDSAIPGTPCGACLQWIAELGTPSTEVLCANLRGDTRRFTMAQLLPAPFVL